MIISFSASVTGINTLLSKKFAWKINDLSSENLLDPVLNYTEQTQVLFSVSRKGSYLTREAFVRSVREALTRAGMDAQCYSGHSFRVGAATTAAACGVEDSLIKTLG